MKLRELKEIVDACVDQGKGELDVCIPDNKETWGGTSVISVKSAGAGFDWNANKFILRPEKLMIEKV